MAPPHPSSQMPGSPHPWIGSLPVLLLLVLSSAPSPVCLAPRLRCIPRWGKWVGVYQVPAGREQQERQHHSRYEVRPLGAGKEAVLLPGPLQLALIQGADAPVRSRDFSAKGSPLTGPKTGQRVRVGSADRLPVFQSHLCHLQL